MKQMTGSLLLPVGLIISSSVFTYQYIGLFPAFLTSLVLAGALFFDHFSSRQPEVIPSEPVVIDTEFVEQPINHSLKEIEPSPTQELDPTEKARKKKEIKEKFRLQKAQREKKREQRELEELQELKEKARVRSEQAEKERIKKERLLEAKRFFEEQEKQRVIDEKLQKKLEEQQKIEREIEEQRLFKERIEREEEERNRPKFTVWGTPTTSNPQSQVDLLTEIQKEERQSGASSAAAEEQILKRYRKERRAWRKTVQENLNRQNAQIETFEQRASQNTLVKPPIEEDVSPKVQKSISVESKKIEFDRNSLKLELQTNGTFHLRGLPTNLHSVLIGANGENVILFKLLDVTLIASFEDEKPIILKGEEKDIGSCFEKICDFAEWKYYSTEAKKRREDIGKCKETMVQLRSKKDLEGAQEKADEVQVHTAIQELCFEKAMKSCKEFYNRSLPLERIDLRGLTKIEDGISYFKERIEEIEKLQSPKFDQVEVVVCSLNQIKSGYGVTLQKEIIQYFKDYRFQFNINAAEAKLLVKV